MRFLARLLVSRSTCWRLVWVPVLGCSLSVFPRQSAAQTPENGIHVNQPKVYDSRELTLMLDNLSAQLQASNYVNPQSLATALGNIQGFRNSDFSASFFANGAVGPGAANVFSGNTSGASDSTSASNATGSSASPTITINVAPSVSTGSTPTTSSTPTASTGSLGSQAPALPTLQTAPTYNPTFGPNSSDLLSDEVNLTYQVYNVSMLLDRSLTDRLYSGNSRLQAVVGFDIDLEPPKAAHDAVAVVEVSAKMAGCDSLQAADCSASTKPVLVALMPEQGSHNAATLSQSAVGFSGAVAAAVYSAGIAAQKRNQVFYLYRDMDTISFQKTSSDAKSIDFGWQFRPVLGRHSVEAGIRHLMVVIGLPSKDTGSAAPQLDFTVSTRWLQYDAKRQTTSGSSFWHSLPPNGSVDYNQVEALTSTLTQTDLGATVTSVRWIPTDSTNGVAIVEGNNFFPGTTVRVGPRVYQTSKDGLTLKSDKELEVSLPLSAAVSGGIVSGRYGEAKPLVSDPTSLAAGGVEITHVQISPEGEDNDELQIDFNLLKGAAGNAINLTTLGNVLNDPIVLVNDKPQTALVRWWSNDKPADDGTFPSHLITFLPAKELEKDSPTVSLLFPFEGSRWKSSLPTFNRSLKIVRMEGNKSTRLLISALDPGEQLCKKDWYVQFEDGVAVHRTDRAGGSTDVKGAKLACLDPDQSILSLQIDAKTLKPYHQFLLVNVPGHTKPDDPKSPLEQARSPIVGSIPAAQPAPPAPTLEKDQKISIAQFETKPITFTGKHLDLVTKVLFDTVPLRIVKQEDKSIVISLSRRETEKAPADIQLQLLSDGNDPVLASFSVTPAAKAVPAPAKGK